MDETQTQKRGGKLIWIIILIVVIVLVVLWQTGKLGIGGGGSDTSSYQAVFLTNNQVYFGKLSNADSQYPTLKEVYYLQITQALQPLEQDAPPVTNINLVKLGGEIHGPVDEMVINRDHILFFEDLKDDSQVVTAIKRFVEDQEEN